MEETSSSNISDTYCEVEDERWCYLLADLFGIAAEQILRTTLEMQRFRLAIVSAQELHSLSTRDDHYVMTAMCCC